MKIEKLTENKIRIVLNIEDLEINNIDFDAVLNNTPETQTLILSILNQAEKDLGFYTQDCKILIEAFASMDGNFVFTITKTPSTSSKVQSLTRKKSQTKCKSLKVDNNVLIYSFRNFNEFCDFCEGLHIEFLSHNTLSSLCKNTSLYFYKGMYYLLISGINTNYKNLDVFLSIVSEFTDRIANDKNFDLKLFEYGKVIFKRNAIPNTINIFVK